MQRILFNRVFGLSDLKIAFYEILGDENKDIRSQI